MTAANKIFSRGFTLLEALTIVAIIAILSAIAAPLYSYFIRKSQTADILLKYDVLRTGVQETLSQGIISRCADITERNAGKNLGDFDARLSMGFEAVNLSNPASGYRPVLLVCAREDIQGSRALEIARAAYDEFVLTNTVEQGAVLSATTVSFAVPLSDINSVACQIPQGASLTPCGDPVATPSLPSLTSPGPQQLSTAVPTQLPQQIPQCTQTSVRMVDRQVMSFGNALDGFVMNSGDLNTGGDMTSFTAEVAVMGGSQVTADANHGATILSYASHTNNNEFLIWNPESVNIEFKGADINTGVNVNDGQNHRITVSWESSTGELVLYDNGAQVFRTTAHQGETIGGNGKLVLGQDQDSYGGGFATNDAFQGKIVSASLARVAVPGANIQNGPIPTALTPNSGLITNVVSQADGSMVDTTGQHSYTTGGTLTAVTEKVPSDLYVTSDCN